MTGILIVAISVAAGTGIGSAAHKICEARTRSKAMTVMLKENNEESSDPNEKFE